jgi:hypothetical protein
MQVRSYDPPEHGVKSRKWLWSAVSWSLTDAQRDNFPWRASWLRFLHWVVWMDTSEIEFGNFKTYRLVCHKHIVWYVIGVRLAG